MKAIKIFIKSAGAILLAAALERFLTAAGGAQYLSLSDALLGIPLRYGLLAVGGLELFVGAMCLFGKQSRTQLGWVVWIAVNYLVLQICLFWMGLQAQGTMVGSLGDPLGLERGWLGWVTRFGTAYFVLGSLGAAGWVWILEPAFVRRGATQNRFQKTSCPSCGGHIGFTSGDFGRTVPCPHCQASIVLHKPGLLKASCFFCKQHIEFPSHAIGTKMACPHCSKDITLLEPG
jgi:hypothetical protein